MRGGGCMKTSIYLIAITCSFANLSSFHVDNDASGNFFRPPSPYHLPVYKFFKDKPLTCSHVQVVTEPLRLLQAAKDALHYFDIHQSGRDHIINPEGFRDILSAYDVKKTLRFVIATIEADKKTGNYRILDPAFIEENFGGIAWNADWQGAARLAVKLPHDGQIRLTSYGIMTAKGSVKKTAQYPCGLYYLQDHSIQYSYTKQQILAGILEKQNNRNKRKALAWVNRQDLEDALMHGTVLVSFSDGSKKILNVDRHNGVPYQRANKNVLSQKRYWFFREIKSSSKRGQQIIQRFNNRKSVIFAGDLYNIGLGKLIAITHQNPQTKRKEMRLGILADTGGAFVNNLYQLDYFGGIFYSKQAMKNHLRTLPSFTRATILYKS